ncbi:MAG TPA: glycosyltransferase, partial [Solirubrobacteraceae bacterium]|nr:glycosyltransferase [Solirubrobacteraceae bacterium]
AAARAGVRALAVRVRAEAAAHEASAAQMRDAAAPDAGADGDAFARDALAVAGALERLQGDRDVLVAYVGKLIVSKGVDLLLASWPLVLERVPRARLAVVGFGAYRDTLERLCWALAAGELGEVREIALAGRALEGELGGDGERGRPLRHLLAFLDGLSAQERERYLIAARALHAQVVFCGRLQHDELAELLPACAAVVVPSTFPEAFGMVAAEAAACGALPISAAHSGLAEVSAALAGAVPEPAAAWLSFAVDDQAVRALARNVVGWLGADAALRARTRTGLVATARERWSWEGVARGVIAAACGELDELARP